MNNNTLVSLAYIKTNDNPLEVFCNYILYCLVKAPDSILRLDELTIKIQDNFGINLPIHMINTCARILRNQKKISVSAEGYRACVSDFDSDVVDEKLKRLHEQEEVIIEAIREFVKNRYKRTWTKEETKDYLSRFMNEEGHASELFLMEEVKPIDNKVSSSWYIGCSSVNK